MKSAAIYPVAWLLIIVFGGQLGLNPWVILALVAAVAVFPVLGLTKSWRKRFWRARGASPTEGVHGTIEPPTDRHAYKAPTTVRALIGTLQLAEVGRITARSDGANVVLKEGGWAGFVAALPEHVTQASVSLVGSSIQSIAVLCDALARDLGPMRLEVDGVKVEIDGTRPHGQLLRDVSDAVEAHARKAKVAAARGPDHLVH